MQIQGLTSVQLLKRAALLAKFPKTQTLIAMHTASFHNLSVASLEPFQNKNPFTGTFLSTCGAACCKSKQNLSFSSNSVNGSSHNTNSDESQSEQSEGEEPYSSVDDIREAVLDAALPFVNEFGWTDEAIAKGAESLGYSAMAHSLVEGGGAELFCWLQQRLNEQLEQRLIHLSKLKEQGRAESKSMMVEEALRYRLELLLPYAPVYAKGVATAVLSPTHTAASLRTTAQLADHICHYTGRTNPNAGWYTSRAAVGVVYKMTELSLLQDQSPDYQDTWQFLHRRVQELERCEVTCASLDSVVENSASVAKAAMLTGLNILGLNSMSR
ncbi:Ubiquinone biosynthesis protein COQ9 [Trinorchestia longiramus]|nr:Ubiquinone biosynthesis protein COQ9 [Trinorchestia longiramus]